MSTNHEYSDRKGITRYSGFPNNNQASIYSHHMKPNEINDFIKSIKGYNDGSHHYEFTKGYGKTNRITEKCDKFYSTYYGKEIDYFIKRKSGKLESHKVRVVGKRKISNVWMLELRSSR